MLDSRYLHLHQALGLGPMWLNKHATIQAQAPSNETLNNTHEKNLRPKITVPTSAPKAPINNPNTPKMVMPQTAQAIREKLSKTLKVHIPEPSKSTVAQKDNTPKAVINFEHMSLTDLQAACKDCQACELHQSRRQAIFGLGSLPARLLIVTSNPSPKDDMNNTLLSDVAPLWQNMLRALALPEQDIFVTSWVKCTPHQTLSTTAAHREACMNILQEQARHVEAILFLGNQDYDLEKTVQAWGKPYFRIAHPARLLRQPALKAQAWQSFKAIQALLQTQP